MADTSVNPDNRARRYVRLQNRRQFTTEFKIEAVRLIEDSGRTSVDVALLRRWRQIYGRDGNVIDLKTAEAENIGKHGLICSMSRKENCWDNAAMESFFHSMKVERVHHCDYQSHDEAKRDLFDYIEVFYNRQRRHSHIGYKTPAEAEAFAA